MSLASWGIFCDSSSIRSFWAMLLPSRVSLLEDPKNCPRKYLKIFTTEFILRQQKILLTIDVIEAWQIGVEPSTSNSFVCFFSSFLCFLVSFEIQVITQKVANFIQFCLHVGERSEFLAWLLAWLVTLHWLTAHHTLGAIACPANWVEFSLQNRWGLSNGILHRFCLTGGYTLTSQDYSPSSVVCVAIWRYLPSL